MRSRTIVSLALFVLVALALPLIINRHGSQANSPATKVPELPSLQTRPAKDYLKERGLYVRLQNSIEAAQYQIDQQPQAQKPSALRSGLRKNNAAEIYEATNPAQRLRARFNGRTVRLISHTLSSPGELVPRARSEGASGQRRSIYPLS